MISCYFENKTKVMLRHTVVDMLVADKNKLLLVKRRKTAHLEGGKWALPGGYLDRDETTKQAAVREVLEETGYQAKAEKLFRILDNPDRPGEKNRQNVAFIYLMSIIKQTGKHDHEVKETRWFDLNNLPDLKTIAFDHHQTIKLYKKYLKKPFSLPVLK